jgi:methylmalonyl-CoA mutase N-terminal domain/subunit
MLAAFGRAAELLTNPFTSLALRTPNPINRFSAFNSQAIDTIQKEN